MAEQERAGVFERFNQLIEADRKKWGGMTAGAHARLGLSELREAFSPGGNIAQSTPYGMWGTTTPGEVAAGRQETSSGRSMEDEGMQPVDGDRAADRGSVYGPADDASPTPSQIAQRHRPEAGREGEGQARSPSDIARDPKPVEQQQEQNRDRDRSQEQSRGR